MPSRFARLGVALLLIIGWSLAHGTVTDLSQRRVLLLYSYHPGFPTSAKILAGIHSVFHPDGPTIDIEYMDSKRLYDPRSRENFIRLLTYKLRHRSRYDLIMSADDNALDLALEHGEELFGHAPVVFLGVNDLVKARRQNDAPRVTGVVEAASFRDTLALARQLLPRRNRLWVLVDSTPSGQADRRTLQRLAPEFDALELHWLSLADLSWEELAARLRRLGSADTILFLSAYHDRRQVTRSFDESLAWVRTRTRVPIWHLWQHGVGQGMLGGVLVSHYQQGRQAALMARRILSGESPADIPVMHDSPNVPTFDYRQLVDYGISRHALPPDSLLLFQPDTLWYRHRRIILGVTGAFALLLGSIAWVLRGNRRLRAARDQLEQTNARFALATEAAPIGVWDLDLNTHRLTWDAGMYRLYRIAPQAFSNDYQDWQGHVHADDRERFIQQMRQAATADPPRIEDFRILHPNGEMRSIKAFARVLRDSAGRPRRLIGINYDISERLRAQEDLERRVRERTAELHAANQELESFAYTVSHDLRGPLRAITGFSEALLEDFGEQLHGEARTYLDHLITGSRRMRDLVEGLLQLSRSTRGELQRLPVDMSASAVAIVAELRRQDPRHRAEVHIEADLWAQADPRLLRGILQNLLGNAWKFTAGKQHPEIHLSSELVDGLRWYCVADNGAGFDMAYADKLFGAFQRLHRQDEFPGTGIGLATVQRIIHRHGGQITAHAEPGHGARFCFTLGPGVAAPPATGLEATDPH